MFIHLHRDREEKYLYQQIYEGIKQAILQRKLAMNEKLPSKRQLADDLQVSVNSVRFAYEQLLAEGYIYAVERQGYFVEDIKTFDFDESVINAFPESLKEPQADRSDWLSFSHMNTNSELFPFKSWTKHQLKVFDMYLPQLSELSEPQGPYVVRESIAKLIQSTRGVKCEPEQIIIHSTSQGLLEQFIFLQPTDATFALENPGYARYYNLLQRHNREVEIIPLDKHGIVVEALSKGQSKYCITTPSHQFPTGKIMPVSRRIELLNWALERDDRYIIEDDYDSEFKYKTDNIPSLQSFDIHQRVIYMGTFSKTLLPGMRICYMVLPPKLLRKYKKNFSVLIQPANLFALYTLHSFIDSGQYEKHVRKMNNYYEKVRIELIKKLTQRFGDKLHITNIPAGLHFLVKAETTKTYEQIELDLQKVKLELYTIRRFLIEDDSAYIQSRYLIIGFANLKEDQMD
ncbi:MAG: PLP-dependent aminotransferase family protein, partial [Lysinibacillus sp.]